MSTEPEKKSLLAPLADAYEPNQADAERVFARIQASLLASGAAVPPASSALPPAAPAPAAAPAAPAAPVAAAGARAGKSLALLGLSVFVLAIVGGAVVKQMQSEDARPVPTVTAPAPVAPSPVIAETNPAPREVTTATTPAIPSISVDSLPSANVVPRGATPGPIALATASPEEPAPAPSAPAADTLEKEARLLAEARRAVQRGEGTRALALLDEHARDYPKGWLASDRAAEHIAVLCSLGRRDEAVREAKVFLEGRPKGPLTRRVTMSCAGEP